ncbi:glutamyl-tRNA reductase [uncultured Intestinimonas sp.]|uniref:glutamyl-tRNA reductase n=1 Tax=uncultured Intestinimonas sp. TaxID=1689265 RepID=UPI0025DC664C|nr:glutamyl-tRNA reductase [uncultured Intestinimonas sp.]
MGIIMSGLDYQKAPIALREQLSFTKTQAGALTGRLAQGEGILGCVLLSTCNRTELYLSCPPEGRAAPDRLLCRAVGLDPGPFAGAFVTRRGEEAVRHLMEVAGGLQSQIWGEDQILSQVKEAIAIAREQGAADPVLETLFRTAVSAGKEIKTKVRLTGVAVSAAARAVEVLRRDLGDLQGRRALVIGNGEMGRLSAALLREAGCAVTVTLRTYRHGETVVPAGCAVTPYGERYASMEGMDILLSATTSPHYTVSARQMSMLKARPSWVVDLAMPRDVDPAAGDLPGVTLYNVDTLGAEQRRGALPQTVTDILDSHMARFYEWSNYRRCLPAIEALKEAIAQRVLTYPELEEDLEAEELVELAVSRAVDLLTGGLKERIRPEDLERCAGKIRVHTAARGQREGRHAHIPFSHVC